MLIKKQCDFHLHFCVPADRECLDARSFWQLKFLIFNYHIDFQAWSPPLENSISLSGLMGAERVGKIYVEAHKMEPKIWMTVNPPWHCPLGTPRRGLELGNRLSR